MLRACTMTEAMIQKLVGGRVGLIFIFYFFCFLGLSDTEMF